MSSSNNDYNNGVYPLSLYLSSLSGHQDIIHNPYNQLTTSPVHMVSAVPESLMDYMAFNTNNALNQQGLEFPEVAREIKKAVVKKVRHSKIHTAQGLRDRRVRLSIGIARQFFDLQDMLGFDKASKTLEWLLKKSRKAIKKVVQGKKLKNDDEDFGNNGGDVEEEEEDEDDDNDGGKSFVFGSSPEYFEEEVVCEVKKAEKRKKKSELSNVSSKGSRTIAKGKAKEVTCDHQETVSDIAQSEIIDPFKRSIIFNKGEDILHSHVYKEAIEEFDNQGYILAKSKINLPTNMGQSYNEYNETFMLMDQGSTSSNNYNTVLPQNLDYNYDQNPFIDQTFCAIANPNFPKGKQFGFKTLP